MPDQPRFVEDGYLRAHKAAEPAIRAQVLAEYSERLEAATDLWQRFLLRRQIEREIQRRIHKIAPPDALY